MRWEAVAINADFWSQVLQSGAQAAGFRARRRDPGPRKALAEIGGFKALADCLADDYQLGNRIAKNGHASRSARWSWNAGTRRWTGAGLEPSAPLGAHHPRLPAAALFFQHPVQRHALAAAVVYCLALPATKTFYAPLTAVVFLLVRIVLAQNLQRRFTPERKLISPAWLVPVKDLVAAGPLAGAFAGNTVEWRGRKMKLRPDGTLIWEAGGH
jgi:ceramide glucosyltransferase